MGYLGPTHTPPPPSGPHEYMVQVKRPYFPFTTIKTYVINRKYPLCNHMIVYHQTKIHLNNSRIVLNPVLHRTYTRINHPLKRLHRHYLSGSGSHIYLSCSCLELKNNKMIINVVILCLFHSCCLCAYVHSVTHL